MAAELSSMRKRKQGGIMTHLSSAACEWFLIFLLFVDAAFSYLLREFAKYCELQTPCPLCSRLDHVFGSNKLGCSWSLVCNSHKKNISSLVFCSVHSKLADACGLCEECFKPIALQNDSEHHKLNLMLDKHIALGSSGSRTCSCCNKTWIVAQSDDESLLEFKSFGIGGYKANVEPPLTRVTSHRRLSRQDGAKKLRDKLRVSMRHRTAGKNSVGTLSRVGYTEFKLSSDSESEFPLPGNDGVGGNSSSIGDNHTRLEHDVELGRRDHPGKPVNNVKNSVGTLSRVGYIEFKLSSDSESEPPLPGNDGCDGNSTSIGDNHTRPEHDVEFGGRDHPGRPANNVISEKKTHRSSEIKDQPGLLDIDELKIEHAPREYSWVESQPKQSLHWMKDVGSDSEVSDSIPTASSTLRITKKSIYIDPKPYIEETCERVNGSATIEIEATDGTSSDDNRTCSLHSYSRNQTGSLWQCENMKLTEEDTESMSQASKSEVGILLKVVGPGPHNEHEESREDGNCHSQSLPLPVSLKRNDSSYESLDGFSVDVEGESIIDQLRRQVEHERSCMKTLYEELEEERNAADIAANQAMAMITRLQEEKAAVETEALQYIRMMELQAECDMESLKRANNLLFEKEKELHTELEFYRNNLCYGSGLEDLHEETSVLDNHAAARCENTPGTSSGLALAKFSERNCTCEPMSSSVSNFGDEKIYVAHSLTKLVKNLYKDYCSENIEDTPDGLDSLPNVDTSLNFEQNGSSASKGNPAHYCISNDSSTDAKENSFNDEKNDSLHSSVAFVNENATLHDRLEALEIDQRLKYRSNLIQIGEDGLQLALGMSHQLRKLRK